MRVFERCRITDSKVFSLPAGACPAFSRSQVCQHCYALKGRYVMPGVKLALARREWWLYSRPEQERFEAALAELHPQTKYVRLYKSGDLRRVNDAWFWYRVIKARPKIRFWLSTKSWINPEIRAILLLMNTLPNVCIRLAGLDFENEPAVPGLPNVSVVSTKGRGCPKQWKAPSCAQAGCRRCWNKQVRRVTYRLH